MGEEYWAKDWQNYYQPELYEHSYNPSQIVTQQLTGSGPFSSDIKGREQNPPRDGGLLYNNDPNGKKVPRGFGQQLAKLSNPIINQSMNTLGNAATAISIATGGHNMYDGPKGGITQGIEQGWDSISNTVGQFGIWGQMAQGIMSLANMGNKIQNAFLGSKGVDNMTAGDAILSSPLGFITGLGLVNALGGSNTQTITKNEEAFSTVGGSYAGTGNAVDDALTKSGKRYGLFSGKQRQQADNEITEAKRQQSIMSGIADNTNIRNDLATTMTQVNANSNMFNMAGGYQQANIHAARYGMKFEKASQIAKTVKLKKENKTEQQVIEEPKEEIIEESKEISYFDNWEYIQEEEISKFQKGGSVNLIPEGALHARKHEIELEDITKKGIPVVSESGSGEIQQHAEIERDEIIFRLEVTEKIEEARKKYESEDTKQSEKDDIAIEIGKLLVEEILYNTQDNTNLLNEIE